MCFVMMSGLGRNARTHHRSHNRSVNRSKDLNGYPPARLAWLATAVTSKSAHQLAVPRASSRSDSGVWSQHQQSHLEPDA